MTIQECIRETVEYLDGVYKDGPHFYLTNDTPEHQMVALIDVYNYHLELNLKMLSVAYVYGIENEVTFDNYGWLKLPDVPEDKIETIESTYGKTEVFIRLAEVHDMWIWTYKISDANGHYNGGSLTYNSPCAPKREYALAGAISEIKSLIEGWKKCTNKKLCERAEACIKNIEDNEQQGKLF